MPCAFLSWKVGQWGVISQCLSSLGQSAWNPVLSPEFTLPVPRSMPGS